MNNSKLTNLITLMLAAIPVLSGGHMFGQTASGSAQPTIVIRLRPVAAVSDRSIRLLHVAELTGSARDQEQFPRLHELDLLAIPADSRLALLDKSLIDVRLQLHGLRPEQYRLLGPDQIIVSLNGAVSLNAAAGLTAEPPQVTPIALVAAGRTQMASAEAVKAVQVIPGNDFSAELNDLVVEASVQTALEQQFGLPSGDVRSQLLRPFVDDRLLQTKFTSRPRLEVVCPAKFPYGRINLVVRIWDGNQMMNARTASVDVRRRQYVLVCNRTIVQTTVITADDVSEEQRFVDSLQDELRVDDAEGQSARRTIRPGEILSIRDLQTPVTAQAGPLVRARDSVRIVAFRKGMKFVVPAAEALQSGREGQMIRVRNIQSNRIVTGRVVGQGEVEVALQ
ncbi:MAG: flagellar basal body P-ring formation chaperone FlgA [Planctomycetaceae bacterium]